MPASAVVSPSAIDLMSGAFYAGDAREGYRWLRQNAPVWYDEANGIWGIATYAAVVDASTTPAAFSNANGSRPFHGPLPMMIDMDDPAHRNRRKLVNRGFTPRRVADRTPRVREICDAILDRICEKGEADFVTDVAAPLPLFVIADLLGVLPEDRDALLRWSDDMVASQGATTEETMAAAGAAFGEYHAYATDVIAKRRAEPTDDLVSVLVHAEVEGDRLSDDELIYESLLILVGGDETTRHVIAGGVEQLLRAPAQLSRLREDPEASGGAVEEMIRWVSPIKTMNRTLTKDVSFHGAEMKAGQQALLLYESANFDDSHFPDPDVFDIGRTPNDHIAFGLGTHFCLGASLARLELREMISTILERLPDLRLATDEQLPRRANNFISGIEHMPVVFTPSPPVGATA